MERKIRKSLRQRDPKVAQAVQRCECNGLPLAAALAATITDSARGWYIRGEAARLLAIADDGAPRRLLLKQFFSQEEETDLWETALTLESLGDRRSVESLIAALHDANPHRRHAAARALGWIPEPGNRAARALADALTDLTQPIPVREEAAESLSYPASPIAIPALISVLTDPDVRIRFWSVFALGGIRRNRKSSQSDRRVIPALESRLADHAIPPGNWWSVAREALAMLGTFDPPEVRYRQQLRAETERILKDWASSPEDRRWAEFYSPIAPASAESP